MNIIPFDFGGIALRTVIRDGEPWFHAADVCSALGIQNPSQALERLAEKHKAMQNIGLPGSAPVFLSEAGLYKLVLRSNKAEAERFQDWITEDVLPSIRTTGAYGSSAKQEAALTALRHIHSEADREVERQTRHSFYRIGNPRDKEHIQAVIAGVATKWGLDPAVVKLGFNESVEAVMAQTYGDPLACARIERQRLATAAPRPRKRLPAPGRRWAARP